MAGRIARSLSIARESYAVLKSNPSLGAFPVISGIATTLASAPFLVVLALAAFGAQHTHMHQQFGALHYAVMAAMYFVNMFIVIFFNSALVACANENLQGRPADVSFGIKQAVSKLPQILCWAAIASTVGMVLRIIGERAGVVGSIVTSIFGLAWNLIVFFVVPEMVLDSVSPVQAIKNSSKLLKQTWGDRIVLGVGMTSVLVLLGLLAFIPAGLSVAMFINSWIPLGIFLAIVAVMYILVLAIVGSALGTIYQTALYRYCRDGVIPQGFAASSMENAFREKNQSKVFRGKRGV